jgi:hypothetical protein
MGAAQSYIVCQAAWLVRAGGSYPHRSIYSMLCSSISCPIAHNIILPQPLLARASKNGDMTTARTHNDISDGREHMHTARRHGDGPASRGVFYPTSPHEPAPHTPATPLPACSPTSPPRAPDSRGAASAREERGPVCFLFCGPIDLSYTVVPPPPRVVGLSMLARHV